MDSDDLKKGDGGENAMELDAKAFEIQEQDFQQVMEELAGDPSLEKFREEYEKIFRSLKKSHEGEKRLIKKCRELNSEIVANAAKVQTALKLSEEDQGTIQALKKEIEKAWKMVDESHEKESHAKETIQQLKMEITNLSKMVEQGSGMGMGQEMVVNELLLQKETLTRERDTQITQIVGLRNEVMELGERVRTTEAQKLEVESEMHVLREQISQKKAEGERELRKKDRMEKEMRDLRALLEERALDLKQKQLAVQQAEEQAQRIEAMLREQKSSTEKVQRDYNSQTQKMEKLQRELDEQLHANTQLMADCSQKQVEIKVKEDEINRLRSEAQRIDKLREATLLKLKQMENQKREVEGLRDELKATIHNMEREVDAMRRASEAERKKQEELMRERDVLNKLKTQAESATQRQVDLVSINESQKKTLEQEVQAFKIEAQKQAKAMWQLEKEREKYGMEASDATAKYLAALEEVKLREMAIIDQQKKIVEAEARLKQQQTLYEGVRGDRNLYSKNLIEAQDDIGDMKRKFKIMQHQIDQLKEEIQAKDMALVKEHFDHMKVDKEKDALRTDLNKARIQIKEAEAANDSQKAEIDKLNHIINEADNERQRQKKEYDIVINERDILGTQLIRRNDELALLYEKIKIQQSTLSKGHAAYRDRLNEIRVLRIRLGDLKRELSTLRVSVSNVDVLRREVHHLGRELLQERTKVKALSEELENPLNVHRWRKLEGSDPGAYEMIQKIQTLQKRLISKTEEVVEKDLLIQEKEKLYVELKNILARQPGPEVAEQLSVYQATLRQKTGQMKAMASELNMYQAQVNEYKYEIERLTRDLQDMKRKFYEQKRREQIERERAHETGGDFKPTANAGLPRFTGGGFSLQA